MVYRIVYIVTLLCTGVELLYAQRSIHVTNYRKAEYKGSNQNWDISLDGKGNVFVANNQGLLTFNGAKWALHKLPANTIIRSVMYDGDRVYTGSFEEFGYWEVGKSNDWVYHSLVPLLKGVTLHNDEIWRIVKHQGNIYFQSFSLIIKYDHNSITPLHLPGLVLFPFIVDDHLYVQQINGGLFEVLGDEFKFIPGSSIFSDTEVKSMLPLGNNELLVGTSSKGIYMYNGALFAPWPNSVNQELIESKVNNGVRLNDRILFGTILNGIYVLDRRGGLISHLNSNSSLQNNTVLALTGDADGNVWVGMDKGIDYISFDSPITKYEDRETKSGTVYSACLFRNELYVGTNQGIYYYQIGSDGSYISPRLLSDSQGQVWFLKAIEGGLYCGLNSGTYCIVDHKLQPMGSVSGGYNLSRLTVRDKEMLIQSTYSAIVTYRKDQGRWVQDRVMEGFLAPGRYFETDYIGNLWVGHSVKGIYMIQPSKNFDSTLLVRAIGPSEGLPGNPNRVFKVDNRIVFPANSRLYRWDDLGNRAIPFDELNGQLQGFESAEAIIPMPDNRYWFVKRNELGMFEIRFGKATLLYRLIPEMFDLNMVEGHENIVALNDSLNLICLDNGFAILNIYHLNQIKEVNKPPVIKDVQFWRSAERVNRVNPTNERVEVAYGYNNLSVAFTSHEPVGRRKYYQYKLEGIDPDWSDWAIKSEVDYTRLPPNTYTFMVRTLNAKGIITPSASFTFRVNPPIYLSGYAYIAYTIMFAGFILLLRFYYRRRLRKHREQLVRREQERARHLQEQAEREIVKLTNEKLQAEISHKNSQLANSTMAIIKKNELLIEIASELESLKVELGYRIPNKYYERIRRLIDQNIESEHDWEMFEKLFDQAHENFFKRLKSAYPDLTPSDLRLCAYLRMNLSSKEIAPLINITTRGVEERRYRLRKRLNLSNDQNLTEFILRF
jgi:hypothetical protein